MRRDNLLLLLAIVAGLSLASADVSATQVCTTEEVGDDEFRGISGTSDDNVIAVGKDGTIFRYDGANWSLMTNDVYEDLNDVEVLGATAFAVGKKGETLQLVGNNWISLTGFTNKDLYGVWAASPTEVYVSGKDGTLFSYDGTSWTDLKNIANTDKKEDLTDIWGYAYGVYAVDEEGVLYIYDRRTGAWLPPDSSCADIDDADKFEDLWGDSNGNVYLVGKKRVYLYDGSSCTVIPTADEDSADEDLLGISGWTQDGSVIAVGKKGTVLEYDGISWNESQTPEKDELLDDWVSPAGNAYYAGKKKALTVCDCVDCPPPSVAQFLITHDSYGIHCQDEVMQVQLFDSISGTPRIDLGAEVTLDTQSGFGSWSRVAGSGSFNDATLNDGLATYDWPLGAYQASFALSYREGPTTIDVDIYQTSAPAIRDNDAEGTMLFAANGFTLTAAALTNPPPALITPFMSPQTAGTDFPIHIAAFGETPNDPVCGIIESYTGAKDLKFWFDFMNPVGGTVAASIDAAAIPTAEMSATNQAVIFTNGQAVVTGKYKDVGRIQVNVKDDSLAHPDLPTGIRGATAGFVVKPYEFVLSNIVDGSGNANPAATDASGDVFIAAGEVFSVTVTALDAEGDVTPNFGQEIIPETVLVTPNLVVPAAGNNPPVDFGTGFGPFAAGRAIGTDFSWPEVGIISLTPSISDSDYLGAGDVTTSPTSFNVGRFIPHHFTTSINTPLFQTQCSSGGFTYIGESFGFSTAPVISFTALSASGSVTQNYTGPFFKVTNSSLQNRDYTATSGNLDLSGLPATSGDPVISDTAAGTGTLLFDSGTGISFLRAAEEAPFDADISLSIDLIDSDGVTTLATPVTVSSISFNNGSNMRFGRVRLFNEIGSERVHLNLRMRAEYYVDSSTGFVTNTDDSCTTNVALSLGAFTDNLADGDTCVLDTGSPGASGAGCAVAGAAGMRYREPPLGGDFNLFLRAPLPGNDGSVDVTADVPFWLEYDWDAASPGLEDPAATATFGIYDGDNKRIYTRELY